MNTAKHFGARAQNLHSIAAIYADSGDKYLKHSVLELVT